MSKLQHLNSRNMALQLLCIAHQQQAGDDVMALPDVPIEMPGAKQEEEASDRLFEPARPTVEKRSSEKIADGIVTGK